MDKNGFRYILLNGKEVSGIKDYPAIYDSTYQFWKENWSKTFEELECNDRVVPNDFFIQDFMSVILKNDKVVAIMFHALFDLKVKATIEHTWLAGNFTDEYLKFLVANKSWRQGLSMSWLHVDPLVRKSNFPVPLSYVIIGLAAKIFLEMTNADVAVGVTRKNRGSHKIASSIGYETFQRDLTRHNVTVDLVYLEREKVKIEGDRETLNWINWLWRNKEVAFGTDELGYLRKVA